MSRINVVTKFPIPDSVALEAQAAAQTFTAKLAEKRIMLNMDMLASLKSPGVHHEMSFAKYQAHFFTINGVLNGKKIRGAMFAGECVLVFGKDLKFASDLAKRGIRDTVKAAHDWYAESNQIIDTRNTLANQGAIVDVGGRRIRSTDEPVPSASTQQRHKMAAMIQSVFASKPFVW